jgi:hypothetical protein
MAKGAPSFKKKKKGGFPPKAGVAGAGKGAPPGAGDKQLPPWMKGKAKK